MPNYVWNSIKIEDLGNTKLQQVHEAILDYNRGIDFNKITCHKNAYEQPEQGFPEDCEELIFFTTWDHPGRIVDIISTALPHVTFLVRFEGENDERNAGEYRIKNGEIWDIKNYDELVQT